VRPLKQPIKRLFLQQSSGPTGNDLQLGIF
jgi:hypothetical protein